MNNKLLAATALALVAGLAGCKSTKSSGGGDVTTTTFTAHGHFLAGEATIEDGEVVPSSVDDRSTEANEVTVTLRQRENGDSVDVDVASSGTLAGGTAIPGRNRIPVDPDTAGEDLASFYGEDAFLEPLQDGEYHAIYNYSVVSAGRGVAGVIVAGVETEEGSMPTSGTAIYSGSTTATAVVLSGGEAEDLQSFGSDDLTLTATFADGGGTIQGRAVGLRDLETGEQPGVDLVFNQADIVGNAYTGSLNLVETGTDDALGASQSSNYRGGFFGPGAAETAGSYQLSVDGFPDLESPGETVDLRIIGGFGATATP